MLQLNTRSIRALKQNWFGEEMKLELHRQHQETLELPLDYSKLDQAAILSLKIERCANLDLLLFILPAFEMNFHTL